MRKILLGKKRKIDGRIRVERSRGSAESENAFVFPRRKASRENKQKRSRETYAEVRGGARSRAMPMLGRMCTRKFCRNDALVIVLFRRI